MLALVDYGDSDNEDDETTSTQQVSQIDSKSEPVQKSSDKKENDVHANSVSTLTGMSEAAEDKKAPGRLFKNLSVPKNEGANIAEQKAKECSKKRKRRQKNEKISFQVPIDVNELKKTEKIDNTPSLALYNQPKSEAQCKSILDFLPPVQHQTETKRRKIKQNIATVTQQFSFETALKKDIAKPILFESLPQQDGLVDVSADALRSDEWKKSIMKPNVASAFELQHSRIDLQKAHSYLDKRKHQIGYIAQQALKSVTQSNYIQ